MWLQNILIYQVVGVPLWVIGICGVLGVFIDFDHIIAYYWAPGLNGRFLHTPILIFSGLVLFGLGTYISGLLIRLVLE